MSVHPHAARPSSHVGGCVAFWLWALVGAAVAFALVSFIGFLFLLPAAGVGYLLRYRSVSHDGRAMLGIVAGAGLPLLLVTGLNWSEWHHRTAGDNTPNPWDWGGAGVCLLAAGIVAYELTGRRRP